MTGIPIRYQRPAPGGKALVYRDARHPVTGKPILWVVKYHPSWAMTSRRSEFLSWAEAIRFAIDGVGR